MNPIEEVILVWLWIYVLVSQIVPVLSAFGKRQASKIEDWLA